MFKFLQLDLITIVIYYSKSIDLLHSFVVFMIGYSICIPNSTLREGIFNFTYSVNENKL